MDKCRKSSRNVTGQYLEKRDHEKSAVEFILCYCYYRRLHYQGLHHGTRYLRPPPPLHNSTTPHFHLSWRPLPPTKKCPVQQTKKDKNLTHKLAIHPKTTKAELMCGGNSPHRGSSFFETNPDPKLGYQLWSWIGGQICADTIYMGVFGPGADQVRRLRCLRDQGFHHQFFFYANYTVLSIV